MARTEPFSAHEWWMFSTWLRYIRRALDVAHDLATKAEPDSGDPISDRVIYVRMYAQELALLQALVYRAAGLRCDEKVCADPELKSLSDELESRFPSLRHLRNALFAHPPFVDKVVGEGEVLAFNEHGVFRSPAEGGPAQPVVEEPLIAHPWVEGFIDRVQVVLAARQRTAEEREERQRRLGIGFLSSAED